MKNKHTPGPYEVRIHDKGPYFSEVEIWHQNYGLIARLPDITSIWNSDKNEKAALEALDKTIATATIMAAAPEMVKLLDKIQRRLVQYDIDHGLSKELKQTEEEIENFIEAIEKATK